MLHVYFLLKNVSDDRENEMGGNICRANTSLSTHRADVSVNLQFSPIVVSHILCFNQ
mgnify:CR=1 FL=1